MMHHGEPNDQYLITHAHDPSHKPVIGDTPITIPPHLLINQQGILSEAFHLTDDYKYKIQKYQQHWQTKASVIVTASEGHSLPQTKMDQLHDYEETSSTLCSAFGPTYVDSHSNAFYLSCFHPPPLP
ncbi:hypothetical protein VNO77_27785 [Canavalia gladiata]|uniref:Uncharacterized protein n=1 Tax=Canavalia gladiata TaxID=3824 RepID=A0AAN9KUM7_CANGL